MISNKAENNQVHQTIGANDAWIGISDIYVSSNQNPLTSCKFAVFV